MGLDVHAPVTLILKANLANSAVANRDLHRCRQSLGKRLSAIVDSKAGTVDGEVVCCGDWEGLAVLESTVLNQLRVNSTITGVVDILATSAMERHE